MIVIDIMVQNEICLFEKDSLEDFICRGFSRDFIKDCFGIDPGYNYCHYKSQLSGIDRNIYKCEYIKKNVAVSLLKKELDLYAQGKSRDEILVSLGVFDKRLSLKKIFTYCGFAEMFREVDGARRTNMMREGLIESYGTDNVFKLDYYQKKASKTRKRKYGHEYTLGKSSSLRKKAMNTFLENMANKDYAEDLRMKREETLIAKYGSLETAYKKISAKSVKTRFMRYGKVKPRVSKNLSNSERHELHKKAMREKYGVDYNMQRPEMRKLLSERVKRFSKSYVSKSMETSMDRYGVSFYPQTEEFRKAQSNRMSDANYQKQLIKARKANGTMNTSAPELELEEMLRERFPDLKTQYRDDIRYPWFCDFYIPSRDLFIELNGIWTHGSHWFDPNDKKDAELVKKWKSKASPYYFVAIEQWTETDRLKRSYAKAHNLNYLVFWDGSINLKDAKLWFAMGCPDAKDWDREGSWCISRNLENPNFGNKSALVSDSYILMSRLAKVFNGSVFYENELKLWSVNDTSRLGNLRLFLFSNRYYYLGKNPYELSDLEILRAFSISGIYKSYTVFNNSLMLQVLKDYEVKSVYDPCAGWGERMLTCIYNDVYYEGVDINDKLKSGYDAMISDYDKKGLTKMSYMDSAFYKPESKGFLITCPPYGNTEIYTDKGSENLPEDDFLIWWQSVLSNFNGRGIAIQSNQKWKDKFSKVAIDLGWIFDKEYVLPVRQNHFNKKRKSEYESMIVFLRKDEDF